MKIIVSVLTLLTIHMVHSQECNWDGSKFSCLTTTEFFPYIHDEHQIQNSSFNIYAYLFFGLLPFSVLGCIVFLLFLTFVYLIKSTNARISRFRRSISERLLGFSIIAGLALSHQPNGHESIPIQTSETSPPVNQTPLMSFDDCIVDIDDDAETQF